MQLKKSVVAIAAAMSLTGCITTGTGPASSQPGLFEQVAGSFKEQFSLLIPKGYASPNWAPLAQYKDVLTKSDKAQYPRVAVTASNLTSHLINGRFTEELYPTDCATFSFVIWRSATVKETVPNVRLCPADLNNDATASRNLVTIQLTMLKNTGSKRTEGPLPPASMLPTEASGYTLYQVSNPHSLFFHYWVSIMRFFGYDEDMLKDTGRLWLVDIKGLKGYNGYIRK